MHQDFMKPLQEGDAKDMKRDAATGWLKPTRTTATLRRFKVEIRRGTVCDRLFHLETIDPPVIQRKTPAEVTQVQVLQAGEENVFKVEEIREKRTTGKKIEYLIKWEDWPEETNTWEPRRHINAASIAAYEGLPPPPPPQLQAPPKLVQPHRPNRGDLAPRAHAFPPRPRGGAAYLRRCQWCAGTLW